MVERHTVGKAAVQSACVRVYARVLVLLHLYVHTCIASRKHKTCCGLRCMRNRMPWTRMPAPPFTPTASCSGARCAVCTEGRKKVAMDGGGGSDGSQGAFLNGDGTRNRRVELAAGLGRLSERHEPRSR